MPRSARPKKVFDLSIHGDDLERDRIQLENNLQRTNLSLHLSSQDDVDDNDSVEYPRHSAHSPFAESFIHRSRDFNEDDTHRGWSYRMEDNDEDGVNPYAGQTISTVNHHASALSLNAGLAGRGGRRDISLSGAEYDPDRPLGDMIDGVDSKMSIFDMDPSRSRYPPPGMSFEPVVVDSTAELDRILESGHANPLSHSSRVRSNHDSELHSDAESDTSISRPKLSDALRRVSFSPRRPRSASPRLNHSKLPPPTFGVHPHPLATSTIRAAQSPLAQMDEQNLPTPKPARKMAKVPMPPTPAVKLQPPTPTNNSRFAKMARGITREIEREAERSRIIDDYEQMNPFQEASHFQEPSVTAWSDRKRSNHHGRSQNYSKSRIYLPDVTGLTNAVESPAKGMQNRYPYPPDTASKEAEERLRATMSLVQSKLRTLEDENSISRRRMRELERELDLCKREVQRERTRILEHESDLIQMKPIRQSSKSKGKQRARDISMTSFDKGDISLRYREVVEEKKALEALITSLRTHLTRLTTELSSHQQLLMELKSLREEDAKNLKEKTVEVQRLRVEVERLAGEIEVLRGVVEEGIRERRAAREAAQSHGGDEESDSDVTVTEGEDDETDADEEVGQAEESVHFDSKSVPGTARVNGNTLDKTMRTDHATIGASSHLATTESPSAASPQRFVDQEELDRIAVEVEERRSERSAGSTGIQSQFQSYSGAHDREEPSLSEISEHRNAPSVFADSEEEEESEVNPRVASPSRSSSPVLSRRMRYQEANDSRPPAPTPAHATRGRGRKCHHDDSFVDGAPFPHMRGARLERLFFSSEHNEQTCTMCQRRRRRPGGKPASDGGRPLSPSWLPDRLSKTAQRRHAHDDVEEDEGFEEGPDDDVDGGRNTKHAGSRRGYARRTKLPPQTVLARVIKEMEDDFGHYKSVYVELAEQYRLVDAASDVPKRNLVAQHLREVIDIIEQKGDQIASLYDLLQYKDTPVRS